MSAARTPETVGPPVLHERRGPFTHATVTHPAAAKGATG